jgi:hypothetical protein
MKLITCLTVRGGLQAKIGLISQEVSPYFAGHKIAACNYRAVSSWPLVLSTPVLAVAAATTPLSYDPEPRFFISPGGSAVV